MTTCPSQLLATMWGKRIGEGNNVSRDVAWRGGSWGCKRVGKGGDSVVLPWTMLWGVLVDIGQTDDGHSWLHDYLIFVYLDRGDLNKWPTYSPVSYLSHGVTKCGPWAVVKVTGESGPFHLERLLNSPRPSVCLDTQNNSQAAYWISWNLIMRSVTEVYRSVLFLTQIGQQKRAFPVTNWLSFYAHPKVVWRTSFSRRNCRL